MHICIWEKLWLRGPVQDMVVRISHFSFILSLKGEKINSLIRDNCIKEIFCITHLNDVYVYVFNGFDNFNLFKLVSLRTYYCPL